MEICKNFYYRVLNGDDLNKICQNFNTSKEKILRNNPSIPLYVGEWIKIEVNNFLTHHVRPAETLTQIANAYSTSKEKLILENNLKTEKLFIGQMIKIHKYNA